MLAKQRIDQERLDELRGVLGKIPGSDRKAWILEVYELRDGQDCLAEVIDIKTGKVRKQKHQQQVK